MESQSVSDQLSENEGGGDLRSVPSHAYTDKFYELFPYYLSIGMTYEQYWEQDCDLVKYYRKAAQIQQDVANQNAWIQGAYFYEVLVDVAPIFRSMAKKGTKPTPYRDSPFDLFAKNNKKQQERIQQKSDEKARAYMEAFAMSTNKKFNKKGGD